MSEPIILSGETNIDWVAIGERLVVIGLTAASTMVPGAAVIPLALSYLPMLEEVVRAIQVLVSGEQVTPEQLAEARLAIANGLDQALADRDRIRRAAGVA